MLAIVSLLMIVAISLSVTRTAAVGAPDRGVGSHVSCGEDLLG